jgi:hypothetical protein
MAFDETEEVSNAALVDVDRIDVPEVVTEEDLHRIWVMTELGGETRPASGYLSNLLNLLLLLLKLDLESCHVTHPISTATAPRCTATSDINPRLSAPG